MNRKLTLLAGAAAGALAALAFRRRSRAGTAADPRADDLRRKLAEARETAADEEDFEAAGMAGETIVEDKPTPVRPAAAMSGGDVDEERRRIHDDARKAADEMRRSGGPDAA
ncbi:MAG: hypothetical protein M3377_05060 [Actinomycetota bacterium]|nr:hypothetical protein [Actinomycetota bacterium]